jgi:signal transduction histidine kinase
LDEVHANSQVVAHNLSEILKVKMESILTNVRIISNSSSVHNQEVSRAQVAFEAAQTSTQNITDSYLWLDSDGRLVWSSTFANDTLYEQFVGADRSDRPYFQVPIDTRSPYITSIIPSIDGNLRFFISQPILSQDREFEGVVVASVQPISVGRFLQSKISPNFQSITGLLDRNGVILYSSSDESQIGINVFSEEYRSQLQENLRQELSNLLRRSLQEESGFEDISSEGVSRTLAYQSMSIDGIDFGVLYVVRIHTFAEEITPVIESQGTLNAIFIIAVGSITGAIALMIVSSNRGLAELVKQKTSGLRQSNESLMKANRKLEEANEQLDEHDRPQREFINIAAHELRTPVQPLLGITELLSDKLQSEKADGVMVSKEEVEMLERNAKRLEKLTQNILDVTRIEGNKLFLNKEKFDLNTKIENTIRDIKAGLNSKTDAIIINFTPSPPLYVEADETTIYEVIVNLLSNAIKFTQKGTIDISVIREGDFAKVTVRDTRTGIDLEVMPKLSTKFVSKSESGTGLGLYISKSVIEAHGGKMWAENNKDGKVANFTFTLPMSNE